MKRYLGFALLVALTGPLGGAAAQARDTPFLRSNPRFLQAFRDTASATSQSTVRVLCDGKDTALGVVTASDGWILTKANDLKAPITVRLRDGRSFDAKLIGVHKEHDLAMLKIAAKDLKPIEFTDSGAVAPGDWVVSVGTAETPLAVGVVSVATRKVAIRGPIVRADVSKSGYLGVALEPGEAGVRIVQVMPDSAAAKAGLKSDDVILSLDGKFFAEPDDFVEAMLKYKPGEKVDLKVKRGEEDLTVTPVLGKRPPQQNRAEFQNRMGSELSSRRSGYPTILQHDSVVRPADCGGPLVDLEGRVVGINISRAGRVESWAVPAEVIKSQLGDLMSGKLAPPEPVVEERRVEERVTPNKPEE